MASELVRRLIEANENSVQAVNGSDIFYKAAERIDFLEEKLNKANELIDALYESGCLDIQREKCVQAYLYT